MRNALVLAPALLAALALASPALAATYYVSPSGAFKSGCTAREMSCDLASGAALAMPGDTVVLMDGVYKTPLSIPNSGTAEAWITFQADECSTPIIEGPGVGPTEDNEDSGVYSATAQYIKFRGIVSRGWSTGFGNGWTGNHVQDSNGNWDIQYCLADGNGRTGFTFYSASNFRLKNSISAHNGSSTLHSWSSGVTLYASIGSSIEGNVSFENMDAMYFTDGSGFIVDEEANDDSFINNIAFRNGGSCLRLTKSHGTKFINNTCYHNAQDTRDSGPNNPGEVYFTADAESSTQTGVTFMNNVFVNTGTGPGVSAIINQPMLGWDMASNVSKAGSVGYFTAPDSDYTLTVAATDLIGKGKTGSGAPMDDIGFDPKCLSAGTPTLVGSIAKASWWQYSVNIDYIKSLGGVQKCFNPKARAGTPDVGAYANGAVTTQPTGVCTPPVVVMVEPPPLGGMGGMGGLGGASAAGVGPTAGADAGGMTAAGGAVAAGGVPGTGGAAPVGGSGAGVGPSAGGMAAGGGMPSLAGGGSGATATAGTSTVTGAAGHALGQDPEKPIGCGCRVAREPEGASLAGLGAAGLALLGLRRRRSFR